MKKIAYIGSGYVGQVSGTASAYYGHEVWLVDQIPEKIKKINTGQPTIFETGMNDLFKDLVLQKKILHGTTDLSEAINSTEICFICVGTPDKGEMIDLSYVYQASSEIGKCLQKKTHFYVVVVKSTVIPNTTLSMVKPLLEQFSGKKAGKDFGIAMNPEFLREGVALDDSLHPDSIVIGTEDDQTKQILTEVYSWAKPEQLTYVGITAAETIKYAKNSFLAMKITFANEWANYCEKVGVDIKEVMDAIGKDKRVGSLFLRSGPGYGGSCFPKDLKAIMQSAIIHQSPFEILETVEKINHRQYIRLIKLAENAIGSLQGKRIAVLGLSFKPNTDDVRDSPALRLINYLDSLKCIITAYCPQGMKMAKEWLDLHKISIIYAQSASQCIENSEIVFIPTDWNEFKDNIPSIKVPVIIGHRDLVDPKKYPNVYTIGFKKN